MPDVADVNVQHASVSIARVSYPRSRIKVTTNSQLIKRIIYSVVVLEEPRWLLYLRPRQKNQWLLFLNDAVTYALQREVFEDNFGGTDFTSGTPLRCPCFLLYLQVSKLDGILG
jgi:hypothetical protein